MCISPNNLPEIGPVACHECWQCRKNRVTDYVGRCIAEQQYSDQTLALTLTYRGDVVNAATLVYADFQKFMKRLRKDYPGVRYIVAGEYGTKKGRAHWHAILFFKGKTLVERNSPEERKSDKEVCLERRLDWRYWPDGFVFFQRPDFGGFEYVLKYILKEQSRGGKGSHFSLSKKPLLGAQFIEDMAADYVRAGLAPQDASYEMQGVRDKKGRHRSFMLRGEAKNLLFKRFVAIWEKERGTPLPASEAVEEYLDAQVSICPTAERIKIAREIASRPGPMEWKDPEMEIEGVWHGRKVRIETHGDGSVTVREMEYWEGPEKWRASDPLYVSRLIAEVMFGEDHLKSLRLDREMRSFVLRENWREEFRWLMLSLQRETAGWSEREKKRELRNRLWQINRSNSQHRSPGRKM